MKAIKEREQCVGKYYSGRGSRSLKSQVGAWQVCWRANSALTGNCCRVDVRMRVLSSQARYDIQCNAAMKFRSYWGLQTF